ncbi:MAG: hypothetical protein M1818_004734 [Claussenomyces sp. TS43310]|nr:MAG: hypothetical protein M1818_004734 [Claussenomyces sp. TS43310]
MAAEADRLSCEVPDMIPGNNADVPLLSTQKQRDTRKRRFGFKQSFMALRPPKDGPRERVLRDSPVVAEIQTNILILDEFVVITDLSNKLSQVYKRPETSILVKLEHSRCTMFGGIFDPNYTLTITAVPSLVEPSANRQNAKLLQLALEEALGVHSLRGVIRFDGVHEDNLAWNRATVSGVIEDEEKGEKAMRRSAKPHKLHDMLSLRNLKGENKRSTVKQPLRLEMSNEEIVSWQADTCRHHILSLPEIPTGEMTFSADGYVANSAPPGDDIRQKRTAHHDLF